MVLRFTFVFLSLLFMGTKHQIAAINQASNATTFPDYSKHSFELNKQTALKDTSAVPEIQEDANTRFLDRRDPLKIGNFLGDFDYISVASLFMFFLAGFASFILGIVGIPFYILALLLAFWGLKRTKKFGFRGKGFNYATIGLTLLSLIAFIGLIVIFIIFLLQ